MFPLSSMWSLQPFEKQDDINPILTINPQSRFRCPVRKEIVDWEGKDIFNPAAVIKDDKVYLLYRAEDSYGEYAGTSRIGLAVSDDGLHFERHHEPVLYPDNTSMNLYEWEGGVEDPRIVEDENGTYIMTYTAYDGETARLCVATSKDLYTWSKQGLVFGNDYADMWSKAGSIVCRLEDNRMVATRVNGKYQMYWGESHIFLAESDDLIRWKPIFYRGHEHNEQDYTNNFYSVITPRSYRFDSSLVEPGPPCYPD